MCNYTRAQIKVDRITLVPIDGLSFYINTNWRQQHLKRRGILKIAIVFTCPLFP